MTNTPGRTPVWDENSFAAARLTNPLHLAFWEHVILVDHPRKEFLLENMCGMRPSRFFRRFTGSFMGKSYDCDSPPARQFQNNWPEGLTSTGESAKDWAWRKIQDDVKTGAIGCLGEDKGGRCTSRGVATIGRDEKAAIDHGCEIREPMV